MKKLLLFASALSLSFISAQTYDNGGLSTGSTSNSGSAAPSGYTWSEVQNNTGNTTESNTTAGYAGVYVSSTNSYFLADDFVVPAGVSWTISSIEFFGYQTSYTGTTSPFNTVRLSIYDTDPSLPGATPIFGDDTTNRFASSSQAMMYRIFNSTVPSTANIPGTSRRIWKVVGNVGTTLQPGTYWVKFQLKTPSNAAAFIPSVTVPGTRGLPTFNAKQYDAISSTWINLVDEGDPSSAPDYPQDVPFVINYTATNLGISEALQYDNRILVYPNPVKESFKISNVGHLNIKKLEIIDQSGRLVKILKAQEEYNVSTLSSGNYILKIYSDEVTKITKLLKQ